MILSVDEIRERMHDASVPPKQRLIITPVLDWDSQAKSGQAAIDLRLGQRFTVPRRTKLDHLDHLSETHLQDIRRYKDEHHVWIGDFFVLHPRQFVLGETLEWVHLPPAMAAFVIGRSSWGRDGLIIATATGVHPGYSGILTLELTNVGEIPLRLYPGLAIAQLFIHQVDQEPEVEIKPSLFAASTRPASADPANKDRQRIKRIRSIRRI